MRFYILLDTFNLNRASSAPLTIMHVPVYNLTHSHLLHFYRQLIIYTVTRRRKSDTKA